MSFSSPDARRGAAVAGILWALAFGSGRAVAQERNDGAVREGARPSASEEGDAFAPGGDARVRTQGGPGGEGRRGGTGRPGGVPAWIPYATAAAFLAHERSAERGLAVDADGTTISQLQGAEADTAGVGGEIGVRYAGERATARVAYVLGLAVRDDEDTGWQSVTHGLQAEGERQLTQRLALRGALGTFIGLRESQSTLDGVGLGGGAVGDPGSDRRLLARIPYLRQDAGVGLTLATSETVRHRVGVAGTALLYPDPEVVEAAGERLFETWTLGPEYGLEWGVSERDTLQVGATAATTWFIPVYDLPTDGPVAADELAPVQTAGLQLGWTRRFSSTFTGRAHVGAGLVWPLDTETDSASADGADGIADAAGALDTGPSGAFLAGVGAQWRQGRWQVGLEGARETTQSEVGAVFATTSARAEARRRLTEFVDVAVRGGVARYDVLTQVFASEADLAAFRRRSGAGRRPRRPHRARAAGAGGAGSRRRRSGELALESGRRRVDHLLDGTTDFR
jgi:hypothetical protein